VCVGVCMFVCVNDISSGLCMYICCCVWLFLCEACSPVFMYVLYWFCVVVYLHRLFCVYLSASPRLRGCVRCIMLVRVPLSMLVCVMCVFCGIVCCCDT